MFILRFLTVFAFLGFGLSQSSYQNASIHSNEIDHFDESHICGSPLFTDEFIEQQREKMSIMYPDEYQRMLLPKTLKKTYNVGETEKFWVTVDDTNNVGQTKDVEVNARLLVRGNKAAIWADVNEIDDGYINSDIANEYLAFLEESTPEGSLDPSKGAYDIVKTYYGNEPNKDGDGITDFLFANLYSGEAGYFTSRDQGDGAGSNKRDLLYMDSRISKAFAKSTLAHEFQHLLHYNYTGKGRKFNEGMSEVASVITGTGFPGFNPGSYLSKVGDTGWAFELNGAHYSMGGLFVLYFAEQLGYASLLKFQEIDASDLNAFQRLLNIYNTGKSVKSWFKQWHIANLLNDKTINPLYGYDYDRVGRANINNLHTTGQVQSDNINVYNYDVNYIKFTTSADSLPITFSSSSMMVPAYQSLEFTGDTSFIIKTLENNQKHIVKDVSSKVKEVVFVVSNVNPVATTYTYKSEGENTGGWFGDIEIAYDDGVVDAFQLSSGGSFGYFGCGGTIDCGFGVAFDPQVAENQLISASINMGFAQDFSSGSAIPASADKDFDFHIWRVVDDNGGVVDVMPPIKIDAKERGISGIGWVNIDLTPYAEYLTNLGEIIIGGVEDDTLGVYFGMSSDSPNKNYTYIYGANTVGPITNTTVSGGDQLDGWNLMFRTNWLVKNTTIPDIHAGFMQHSVFNDQMKIYILGNSIFNDEELNVYVTNESEVEYLITSPMISSNSSIYSNYKLKNSGSLDIRVSGSYLYSALPFDTTFKYNVGYADLTKTLATSSRDGRYKLTLAENSFDEKTYVVIGKNSHLKNDEMINQNVLSDIYSAGPIDKNLNNPAYVSFEIDQLNSNISIGYWDGDSWFELQSYVTEDKKSVFAYSDMLGHFALIEKGSGAPLSTFEEMSVPTQYALSQNYPNPFNPETRISYDIISSGMVSIIVYDILGRKITDLVKESKTPGRYNVLWNGNDALGNPVGSGVYLYQLKSGQFSKTRKMVISR